MSNIQFHLRTHRYVALKREFNEFNGQLKGTIMIRFYNYFDKLGAMARFALKGTICLTCHIKR
jgi:hypothetical protein